ncbi:MAG TPA: hypothetical protein VKJ00_06400 [Thermoanaerobaculia bacterium]|nr:hypothetical protein [Thermoanaerobaculia bacterium]HMF08749.1 hypothetical protein [Thermoanaerobaculia bacterium]
MQSTEPVQDAVQRSRDVNTRGALIFAFWLAVVTIGLAGLMYVLFRIMATREDAAQKPIAPAVAASLQRTPPEPRLEALPLVPRQKLRAEEDAILTSYAWVDKPGGFVRIPVDRAMEIVVERGLPPSKPMAANIPMPMPMPGAAPAPAPPEPKR